MGGPPSLEQAHEAIGVIERGLCAGGSSVLFEREQLAVVRALFHMLAASEGEGDLLRQLFDELGRLRDVVARRTGGDRPAR